jgi:hypothetical protein
MPPLSAEETAELTKTIGESLTASINESVTGATSRLVNDAITARFKTFESKMGTTLQETIAKSLEGFRPQTDPDPTKDKTKQDPKDVAFRTMESKLAEITARADAADARAKGERAKNRESSKRNTIADHLTKLGFTDPIGLKLAVTNQLAEGRIQWEDDDNDDARLLYKEDGENMIDLAQGLKKWTSTPEAKHFMPASGTRGSGSNPSGGQSAPAAGSKEEKESRLWGLLGQAITQQGQ